MAAAVDARAMLVRDGDAALAFALDCARGTAVLDPGGDPLGVRILSWGEKCALARFAGAGAAFVEREFLGICAPGLGDRAERPAALALLMWLHAPSAEAAAAALPLDALLLAEATAALCPALGIGPAELAARPAPEVELLWRAHSAARETTRPAPALRSDDATTRILIEPDPAAPPARPDADEPRAAAGGARAAPDAADDRRVEARGAGGASDPIVASRVGPASPPDGGTAAPARADATVAPPRAPSLGPSADAQRAPESIALTRGADEPARPAAEAAPGTAPPAPQPATAQSAVAPPPPRAGTQPPAAPAPASAPETPMPQTLPFPAHAAPTADLALPPPNERAQHTAKPGRPRPSLPPQDAPPLPTGRIEPTPPAAPPLDPRLAALIAFVARAPEADRADADADADPAAAGDALAEELAAAAAELGIVRAR